jgi:alpha/beta superfamily hydrolase
MKGTVILSHGSQSGPDATKVTALAQTAMQLGWCALRPDYRNDRTAAIRLDRLLQTIDNVAGPVVLVGSSLGAYISCFAAAQRPVQSVFLLALPPHILGEMGEVPMLQQRCWLIHGWHDELIPVASILPFAQNNSHRVLLLDSDHRLSDQLKVLQTQFTEFLESLA